MKLSAYLSQRRGLAIELSRQTGLAPSSISRLAKDQQRPSCEAIEAIASATGGAVSPADWFAPSPAKSEAA